jgi:hypothetical protein
MNYIAAIPKPVMKQSLLNRIESIFKGFGEANSGEVNKK